MKYKKKHELNILFSVVMDPELAEPLATKEKRNSGMFFFKLARMTCIKSSKWVSKERRTVNLSLPLRNLEQLVGRGHVLSKTKTMYCVPGSMRKKILSLKTDIHCLDWFTFFLLQIKKMGELI